MFFEELPSAIRINDIDYLINTDFRIWLKFNKIVKCDKKYEEKLADLLQFFNELNLPTSFDLFEEIIDNLVKFYAGGETRTNKSVDVDDDKESFDFELDSAYIYASFLNEYNINLTVAKLHWWEFKALFQSLSTECIFSKIVQYRTINIKDVPKEQKEFYRKMKKLYSLGNEEEPLTVEDYHKQIMAKVDRIFARLENKEERGEENG